MGHKKKTDFFRALNVGGPPGVSIDMPGGPYLTFNEAKLSIDFCGP